MLRILSLIILLVISLPVLSEQFTANNQQPGSVHIFPNSRMFVFYADVTSGVSPTCSGENRWALNTSYPSAKELISMVITAKATGKTMPVIGSGNCNQGGYGYEIHYLYLN